MSRLESIKKKINHNKEESNWEENYDLTEDAEYLIQRLEHYETALKKIDTTETLLQAKFFAMEALKEE